MNKKMLTLVLVISFSLLTTTSAFALQQAKINRHDTSVAYGVQTLNGDLIALNLEGDIGLSSNLGLEGVYTHYSEGNNNNNVVDLNAKLSIIDNRDLDLSGIIGYHTKLENDHQGYPRVGIVVSKRETDNLGLNAGFNFLLGTGGDENYVGYSLGFDYKLTRHTYLEIEHRRFAGQDKTEGLNVGMRYYF
ncbi:outer membrane beta-barrel protein [Halanaerobaculum tunisiense]